MATSTMGQPAGQPRKRGSIGSAMIWMFALEILLFWIPIAGSAIAGFVGGRKAGELGNAMAAVFIPVIVFAVVLGLTAKMLLPIPLAGTFAGLGGFMFATTHAIPLLAGAAVGGLTVDRGGL